MARRIRSIKPEILDDAVTAALPHIDWRLFVSLWLMADDYGNLHGHAAQVKGAALWATPDSLANVRESLARLSDADLIRCYTVRGQPYVAITGWSKHQKVDHPGKAIIPGPAQADSSTSVDSRESLESSRESRESLATDLGSGTGTRTEDLPSCRADARPDLASEIAAAVVPVIAEIAGRAFDPATIATVRLCKALARARFPLSRILAAVRYRAAEWMGKPGMVEYVRPSSLLTVAQVSKTLDEIDAGPARTPPTATAPTSSIDATAQALRDRGFLS